MSNRYVVVTIILLMVFSFYVGNIYHEQNPKHEMVAIGTYICMEEDNKIIYTTDDSIRQLLKDSRQLPVVDDVFDDNGDHITWFLIKDSVNINDILDYE